MYVCMYVCMHGWMDRWMDGCMHAWMHVGMYVCLYVQHVNLCVYMDMCMSNYVYVYGGLYSKCKASMLYG